MHPDLIRHYCRVGLITAAKQDESGKVFFPDELIDQLLTQVKNKDVESGLAGQLKK
jgi:DNA-binding transcriptional MerR regulator